MQQPDKDHPSAAWISSLRQRFPTETEVDRILTRRQERRSGPAYKTLPLPELCGCLESLLHEDLGSAFEISDAHWLSGGASKVQMAFNLEWERPGLGFEKTAMVLRMEPAESIVETSRLREFQLIKAFEGVVPIPHAFWCDADARHLPYPSIVYGFAPGVTKPTEASGGVTGMGILMPPTVRAKLGPQFVEHLCTIHNRDFSNAGLDAFNIPATGTTQCAEWCLNSFERVWEEDCGEDIPLMRVVAAWLRRNLPVLDRPSIIHADYRSGNFLFTEHDTRITAILDWELGHIGDRHQDLAWTTSRAFGSLAEDGRTFLVSGLMSESEFFDTYQRASGFKVDPRIVHWYKIFNAYSLAVMTLATGYRAARNGKTHQDVLVTWVIGVGYGFLEELRELIEVGY
ncbi:MAG: phosphotransferase family protein [Proteobacteria bacterium]|nr:phosphotransferase family protein [Pseudomonadota bacterium]